MSLKQRLLKQKILQQKTGFESKSCNQYLLAKYLIKIFKNHRVNFIIYFILIPDTYQIYYETSFQFKNFQHQFLIQKLNLNISNYQSFIYVNYNQNLYKFYMYNDLGQLVDCDQHKRKIYWSNYGLLHGFHYFLIEQNNLIESQCLKYEIDN